MSQLAQIENVPAWPKKWLVAMRTFALPASTISVVFGTVLALTVGDARFEVLRFVAAFLGMAMLHTGANILNDVLDHKNGLDRNVNPVSGAVVRGWITYKQGMWASGLLFALGSLLGLWLVLQVGWQVLLLGCIGIVIGVIYTWGPFPLKNNALGDLAVFVDFGILGSLGAWTIQTGEMSWVPVVWAIPLSMLVSAILHSNNWRDIQSDSKGDVRTIANLLGDKASEFYYWLLVVGPFVFIITYVILSQSIGIEPAMPYTFLIVLIASPLAVKLLRRAHSRQNPSNPIDFLALDGATAQLNLLFGLLCTVALGLSSLIG